MRTFLLLSAAFLFCARPFSEAARPDHPNIVFILADDLGYSDLGCYGSEIHTPNLDRLAQDGLRFTQFYNTARCWPSRAALLTGFYAQQIRRDTVPGVPSGGKGVRPGWARLLPDLLRAQGYRSYHSGKWHVDGMPVADGFDHSYYVEDLNRYFSPKVLYEDDQKLPPVDPGSGYYITTAIAEHAIKCLKEHAERFADRPFFQYIAFNAPHFPLQALPEDIARYAETYRAGWNVTQQARYQRMLEMKLIHNSLPAMEREVGPPYAFPDAMTKLGPGEINRPLPWAELTSEQRDLQAVKMSIHAAMIDRMDREIGRVVEQLKRMGAFEDTVIFFASDNGASAEIMVRGDGHDPQAAPGSAATHLCLGPGWSSDSNTPLRRHKTWVHEGGISTPLIAHWPKGIDAHGALRHTPAHLIDIVPTALDLAGARRPETWEGQPVPPAPGRSLVPVFARDGAAVHDELWWAHEGNRAIRVGDWKLVAAGESGAWELYDLSTDRGEMKNLAGEQPDKVRDLAARWTQRWDEFRELAARDAPPAEKRGQGKKKDAD
jgi:arylsulfatase